MVRLVRVGSPTAGGVAVLCCPGRGREHNESQGGPHWQCCRQHPSIRGTAPEAKSLRTCRSAIRLHERNAVPSRAKHWSRPPPTSARASLLLPTAPDITVDRISV